MLHLDSTHQIYTVSRDGALFVWGSKTNENGQNLDQDLIEADPDNKLGHTRWAILQRHYFNQPNTKVHTLCSHYFEANAKFCLIKVTCAAFHEKEGLLVIGFASGIFGLWEVPA